MNKMYFLTCSIADVETSVFCSSSLQAVIDYLKKSDLLAINYRIYTSSDFLNVRFLDNKLMID